MIGLSRLSLNQATVRNLTAADAIRLCVKHEIPGIGLWRDRVAELGLATTAAAVRSAGLHVSSLCRGGFFTHADADARAAALADNRAAVNEAAELQADTLILVSGGLVPGSRDLALARRMIADAIAELVLAAGYTSYAEVEILNADIWDAPADETALQVRSRFADLLG